MRSLRSTRHEGWAPIQVLSDIAKELSYHLSFLQSLTPEITDIRRTFKRSGIFLNGKIEHKDIPTYSQGGEGAVLFLERACTRVFAKYLATSSPRNLLRAT